MNIGFKPKIPEVFAVECTGYLCASLLTKLVELRAELIAERAAGDSFLDRLNHAASIAVEVSDMLDEPEPDLELCSARLLDILEI